MFLKVFAAAVKETRKICFQKNKKYINFEKEKKLEHN